jgi:hypothetical protein
MSNALRVHPAAVMVSALVAFNLLGVIGVVLAAPVLATLKLFFKYVLAKLFDQDPWANLDTISAAAPISFPPVLAVIRAWVEQLRRRISRPGARVQQHNDNEGN